MRALRAQIDFRSTYMCEPSDSDIQAHLQHRFANRVTYREISAAFRSGKEVRQTFVFLRREKSQTVQRLVMKGIQCVEYDSHLATIIQRAVEVNNV
jgi:hypothetical protein